jgi:hypothetical protein
VPGNHRARWVLCWPAALCVLGSASSAAAHGFGQRYDLPVPLWLYVASAAATVVVSFVVVGLFVRGTSAQHTYPRLNLLGSPLGRLLVRPGLQYCLRLVSVLLFVFLIVTGLFGNQSATRNLAPTLVWVIWWVGLAYASALVGNFWALINPWKVLFTWAERAYRGIIPGGRLARHLSYPRALGIWPGVILFLAFAWIELVFAGSAVPAKLATLTLLYSVITWTGMWLFGRDVWLRHGEVFSLVFGLLSRFAPTEVRVTDLEVCRACSLDCRDHQGDCIDCYACFNRARADQRQLNLRPYAVGLARNEHVSVSEMVFVLVLLASVTFDGFMATPLWVDIETTLQGLLPGMGGFRLAAIRTLGLLAVPLLFLEVYVVFSILMGAVSGRRFSGARLTRTFAFTLVPIAIAYHIAHYLSFLLIQGQRIVPLLSDPFGAGWDLLGTAAYRLNIGVVGARFGWYTAVLTIVAGHILAVYLAHLVALRTLRDHRLALRSQYPMLVLMVAYTVISLWILSQPIVVEGSAGLPIQTTVTAEAATAQPVSRSGDGTSAASDRRAAAFLAAMPLLSQNQADGDVTVRNSILCFCLNKGPETIRELRRAADAWFTKGLAAYRSGQYAAAITAFTEAIQRHPRYARAYTNRGILYGKTGAYQQAQADLTQAITLQPDRAEAHYVHGLIAALLGDATRASRDVQRAADLGYPAAR